jgi:hypothetical protein
LRAPHRHPSRQQTLRAEASGAGHEDLHHDRCSGSQLSHHADVRCGYVVNGHAASPAETQVLVSYGVQPGQWVVNGYGISPARDEHVIPMTTGSHQNSRYVLDVLLCD